MCAGSVSSDFYEGHAQRTRKTKRIRLLKKDKTNVAPFFKLILNSYSSFGINQFDSTLRTPNCLFVLFVGTKKLVRRKDFEQFISEALII